ncbi:MAG: hypothetical protein ACO3XN_10825, partial [Chthoniobacterales bacterium]
ARLLQRLEQIVAAISKSSDLSSSTHNELVRALEELLHALHEYSAREEHELREKILQLAELREGVAHLAVVVQKEVVRAKQQAAGAVL